MAETYLKRTYYDPNHPAGFGGVDAVYRAARRDGVKVGRKEILEWLRQQPTYTLHKPVRRRFRRNRVVVHGMDQQWQADLVDMSSLSRYNRGYKYILTCIDILSKYAWAVPLKDKKGKSLTGAFEYIFKSGRVPEFLQTDKGTEFINRRFQSFLKGYGVRFFTTQNETKASVVERFNRTLKTRMWKYFTANNTYAYVNVLPRLIHAYNHAFHRSIKATPASVNLSNAETVRRTLYSDDVTRAQTAFRHNVGDTVRISMTARPFRKGYLPNWTTELFTVKERISRSPPVYKLKDYAGEELKGTFYDQELQKVVKEDDVYQVERVLDTRKKRGRTEYFVKWSGYPDKFNSWVPKLLTS